MAHSSSTACCTNQPVSCRLKLRFQGTNSNPHPKLCRTLAITASVHPTLFAAVATAGDLLQRHCAADARARLSSYSCSTNKGSNATKLGQIQLMTHDLTFETSLRFDWMRLGSSTSNCTIHRWCYMWMMQDSTHLCVVQGADSNTLKFAPQGTPCAPWSQLTSAENQATCSNNSGTDQA